MKKIVSILAFAASVLISWKYCAGYWVVGPVFAAAVLLIHGQGKKLLAKHAVFFLASTFIYALVFFLANKGWKVENDWLSLWIGPLTVGVIAGSILMTSVHAYFFGTDLKTARATAFALILSWYLIMTLSTIDDTFHWDLPLSYSLIAIALWQGIYLRRMKLS